MSNRISFAVVCLLIVCSTAYGQSNYGVITGTVMDPQRLPISGATVLLTAKSTGTVRQVVSNQEGIFEAPFLLPDDYVVESRASGFATTTQSVRLEVGQKLA
jgi:Carboxypeptidase regulatory-like domain